MAKELTEDKLKERLEVLENEFGHLLEEAGGGMPADLTLGLDSDASFTVS